MSDQPIGLLIGIALGIPVGYLLRALVAPVDRWLDERRRL